MLNLKNADKTVEFYLTIEDPPSNNPGSRWCLVKVIVIQGEQKFQQIYPALQHLELVEILEWFRRLSKHKLPRFGRLSFTYPCLEFEFLACDDEIIRISIGLRREMRPSFDLRQLNWTFDEWDIVFELGSVEFKTIIGNIQTELTKIENFNLASGAKLSRSRLH
ncbi:MAG: hypothetical protein AAF485_21295 [Chloroflexota bacterium]